MLFAISTLANAQFFIGGSFSLSTIGGHTESGNNENEKNKVTNLSFQPKAGIFISENFMVGAGVGLSFSNEKIPGDPEVINRSSTFSLSPFARYYALQFGDFMVFGQGQLSLSTESEETETAGTTTNGPTVNTIGLSAFPGLAYNIGDMVQLEAYINGFNFGITRSTEKIEIAGTETKDVTTRFGLGANLNNIFSPAWITVGAIIKL
jgi:outer membrane protein